MRKHGRWTAWLGIAFVAAACLFFCVRGYQDQRLALQSIDFKPIYGAARCMLAGCDPYDRLAAQAQFLAHGGDPSNLTAFRLYYLNYPPNAIFLTLPLALLPWPLADALWLALLLLVFCAGTAAITELCLPWSPVASTGLLAIFVATSLMLVMLAQPAALAIGLCCLAVWCFVHQRLVGWGILCFALSLVLKPHLCGPVLLYFLVADAASRARAWKVIGLSVLLSLPGVLWVTVQPSARHWATELGANLVGMAQKGDLSDPGPTNLQASQLSNLQAVFSLIHDDRAFYNHASWAAVLVLLLAWLYPALRGRPGREKDLLCVAAIAAITLLPIVHRTYDTRLLLLTFPAAAWLTGHRRNWGLAALVLTACATLMTFSQAQNSTALHRLTGRLPAALTSSIVFLRPVPMACLGLAIFYIACSYVLLFRNHVASIETT